MLPNPEQQKADLVEQVIAEAKSRLNKQDAETAATFIRAYFRRLQPDDVLDQPVEKLFGAALSLWHFGTDRKPGTPKIRVYNPSLEENGWQCDHTVVEVVNDDMPFLVDSVTSALSQEGVVVHLLVHPLITVPRDDKGRAMGIVEGQPDGSETFGESFMHVEFTRQSEEDRLQELLERISSVLEDVRVAVHDWRTMTDVMTEVLNSLKKAPANLEADRVTEVREFLSWVRDGNFTFLGYENTAFVGPAGEQKVKSDRKLAKGLLARPQHQVFKRMQDGLPIPVEVRTFVHRPDIMMVTKANLRSTVHRAVHLDTICIKSYDAEGRVSGQHCFVGLFTASAYNRSPADIPLLSRKVKRVLDMAGLPRSSHDSKILQNVLDTFPRDELFQIAEQDLLDDIAIGILHLQQQPAGSRCSCARTISSASSPAWSTSRATTTRPSCASGSSDILEAAFEGETSAYYIQVSDGPLARLHIDHSNRPRPGGAVRSASGRKAEIVEAARSWTDLPGAGPGRCPRRGAGPEAVQPLRRGLPAGLHEHLQGRCGGRRRGARCRRPSPRPIWS